MHDHRRLGRELDLFDTDPLIGAGLPYWLPDGAIGRRLDPMPAREALCRIGALVRARSADLWDR